MKWEDQEINYTTDECKFIEIVLAKSELFRLANRRKASFLYVDQEILDELIRNRKITSEAAGARIDRLCLHLRLFCKLSPGGGKHTELGLTHYWSTERSWLKKLWYRQSNGSRFVLLEVFPKNDWLSLAVVAAKIPERWMGQVLPETSPKREGQKSD